MSSRGIFILAITWIVMSPFWFWAENIALGIIWLCGGVIELFIALVRCSKEKKKQVNSSGNGNSQIRPAFFATDRQAMLSVLGSSRHPSGLRQTKEISL